MKKIFSLIGFTFAALAVSGCIQTALTGATGIGYSVAQERSFGAAIDDATISTKIESEFIQKNVNEIFHKVDVEVHEGRVLLTGVVQHSENKIEAARLAWQPDGVMEVINEIQVSKREGTPKTWAKDAWITAQVKARMLVHKDIESINYTVETVNRVVYLMGIAQNQVELDNATHVASIVKGVKSVRSHVRLKDSPIRRN